MALRVPSPAGCLATSGRRDSSKSGAILTILTSASASRSSISPRAPCVADAIWRKQTRKIVSATRSPPVGVACGHGGSSSAPSIGRQLMTVTQLVLSLLNGGLGSLAAYLAAHVLLCLVPAFYIAGAMTALIPKESVTRFLGRNAPKWIAYPGAALAGSVLAVCSCTIVPLFAGIYKKGAGIGPAITFLFFAPAANVLALVYTGGVIGVDLALARLILSLTFGIGIGLIMALIFAQQDKAHAE